MGRAECIAACNAALSGLLEHPAVAEVRVIDGAGGVQLLLVLGRYQTICTATGPGDGPLVEWWLDDAAGRRLDLVALARRIGRCAGMRSCALEERRDRHPWDEWTKLRVALAWGTAACLLYPGTPIDLAAAACAPTCALPPR